MNDVAYELSCSVGAPALPGAKRLCTEMTEVQYLASDFAAFLEKHGFASDLGGIHTLIVIGVKKAEDHGNP